MYVVPRLWPGSTIVCLASGPSLTREDVAYVRGKARTIVVNTTYQLAPWADVLYACDARWWRWHKGAPDFPGLKFTLTSPVWPDVHLLKNMGPSGLEVKPHGLRTGRNSGYQAVNLAVHLGARRILLLGYDMQRTGGRQHWHPNHPVVMQPPLNDFVKHFPTMLPVLEKLGVEVVNCTRETAITCFPRMPITEALPADVEEPTVSAPIGMEASL
jgi:hypothetical protein